MVVGNPKPDSRTLQAARLVANRLIGTDPLVVIDLVTLGAELLDFTSGSVAEIVDAVSRSDLVVFATPTYKSSYSGVLKLFLDRISAGALSGVVAVPVMLGAGPGHQMAGEVFLKPVLVELGASCPTRALYLLDSKWDDEDILADWLAVARPRVLSAVDLGERRR